MRDVFHDPGWAKLAQFRATFPKVAADLAAIDGAANPDRLPTTAFADPSRGASRSTRRPPRSPPTSTLATRARACPPR